MFAAGSEQVQTWGNVNAREMGSENVVVPSTIFQKKVYTFSFPKVCVSFELFIFNFEIWSFHQFAQLMNRLFAGSNDCPDPRH